METALQIVQLLNALTPGVAQLLLIIKNKDGSISVGTILDRADPQFDANLKQATDWFAEHPV